jgi:hypothetical protein
MDRFHGGLGWHLGCCWAATAWQGKPLSSIFSVSFSIFCFYILVSILLFEFKFEFWLYLQVLKFLKLNRTW